eukprot:CAMPEP_0194287706 /NCGR_PEP_ID=MMETSP0169-20130528/35307_1 /TAXON_ID=218684 /ORGANISM="Corethron pennatum, Strain L29A3" /LENGTH=118 /DNA_ID=CAMNT_0039034485 /DNA_START=63 /DNA_END=419 /DNA_ORIENTATION=-
MNAEKIIGNLEEPEAEVPSIVGTGSDYTSAADAERDRTIADAANVLSSILDKMKESTNDLLGAIKSYADESRGVSVDFERCRESQDAESQRLQGVMPDVEGAVDQMVQQAITDGGCRA